MSVKDIEIAISQLSAEELKELSEWLASFRAELWDLQIERDSKAGRLDLFIREAKADFAAGNSKPL